MARDTGDRNSERAYLRIVFNSDQSIFISTDIASILGFLHQELRVSKKLSKKGKVVPVPDMKA
jgi:hypothetical protein